MPKLLWMEPFYVVCDDSASVYDLYTGNLKKEIPLTMSMVVKLMHEIITYTVTNMKAIMCFHLRRNHCVYLSTGKLYFQIVCCSTRF